MVWTGLPRGVGRKPSNGNGDTDSGGGILAGHGVGKLNARPAGETVVAGSVELEPFLASSCDGGGLEKRPDRRGSHPRLSGASLHDAAFRGIEKVGPAKVP